MTTTVSNALIAQTPALANTIQQSTATTMPHHLLTIPSEIRLRILEYAVTIDPVIICDVDKCHDPHDIAQHGFISNPNLAIHLICSQIYGELEDIDIPRLDLKMCLLECVDDYFAQWSSMKDRIKSVEVPFKLKAPSDWTPEELNKGLLDRAHKGWTSEVQIVNYEIRENIFGVPLDSLRRKPHTGHNGVFKGKAIFRR